MSSVFSLSFVSFFRMPGSVPSVVAAVVAIQVSDPPFLFVIVTTAPSISRSPPGGPRLWCSFVLGMGEFEFYSDASEYFTGVRNLDLVASSTPNSNRSTPG